MPSGEHSHGANGRYTTRIITKSQLGWEYLQLICDDDGVIYQEHKLNQLK